MLVLYHPNIFHQQNILIKLLYTILAPKTLQESQVANPNTSIMSLYQVLKQLPRPIIHHTCWGCHGCKSSCDHIIPVSTLKAVSMNRAKTDPHNVFLICHSLNKRKENLPLSSTKLLTQLTDDGKGTIARAILYMNYRYGIKIYDYDLMKLWHLLYPPNIDELARHQALRIRYGMNPYIENTQNQH